MQSSEFVKLRDFILQKMRMSHIYQPLMIRTLLQMKGRAGVRDIARSFLMHDESQLEYYEQITKNMPGKVLAKHGLVQREGDEFRLLMNTERISDAEVRELVALCEKKLDEYIGKRGKALFAHRSIGLGYVPGSVRYEVLKRAGRRCELCGVPGEERALEVDHIIPRKHGGSDDISNFQALCWKCNANKGARDATDFRDFRDIHGHREGTCLFCTLAPERVISENALALVIRDGFPVTALHTLVIPKRHVATYFDLYASERRAIERLVDNQRDGIIGLDKDVKGFNIGINSGEVAGQTVMHCHVHLIPRRAGDVQNPRGGIRHVIPGKGIY